MLRFIDGFDSYSSTDGSDLDTKYDLVGANTAWSSTAGRFGGGCLVLRDASGPRIVKQFIPEGEALAGNTVCVAFWFRTAEKVNMDFGFLSDDTWSQASSGDNLPFALSLASGRLFTEQWGSTSVVAYSDLNICDDQWHFIEMKCRVDGTTGIYQVYIDGALYANVSSGDTFSSGTRIISSLQFVSNTVLPGTSVYIDDVVVYDDIAGTTAGDLDSTTDFPIGPIKIETSRPASTGANEDFTGVGSTSNVLNVDESGAPDDDTTYNGTETSTGAVDTFGYDALTSTGITQVTGVVVTNVARKDGLGDIAVRGVAISSGSTSNGDAFNQAGGYVPIQTPFIYDPATSTRWTTAGLDAAEFGYATSSST